MLKRFLDSKGLRTARTLYRFLILAMLVVGLAGQFAPDLMAEDAMDEAVHSSARVLQVDIEGAIGPATAYFLKQGLKKASAPGPDGTPYADAVLIRMYTPGGLVVTTRDMIQDILDSKVPVIGFVYPPGSHAASAGTYILYATHVAAMAPGTNIGAATPVAMGGFGGGEEEKQQGEEKQAAPDASPTAPKTAMESKAMNDMVALMKSLSELRGRNAEWAEAAVREAETLTASEAVEINAIDLVADDIPSLLSRIDGRKVKVAGNEEVTLNTRGAVVEVLEADWKQRFMNIITDPNLTFIFITLGMYGLIYELANPGALVPGTVGVISIVLAMLAMNIMPINYGGLALLILGIVLMAAEAFVPSFGVLGIGGTVCFVTGAMLMYDSDIPGLSISPSLIFGLAAISVAIIIFLLAYIVRTQRRPATTGQSEMLHSNGDIIDWKKEHGHVFVNGERWKAVSEAPFDFAPGERVHVVKVEGLTLTIEPIDEEAAEPDGVEAPA